MQINSSDYYLSAYAANATYQNGNFSLSGSYLEITGGMSTSSADGVDVSEKAKEMLDRIKNLDVFKIIYPNSDIRRYAKSLYDFKNDFMSDLNNFSSMFGKMAQMMGLDSSSGLTMGLDGQGGMTVNGDSSAASKVSESLT
ncbi:MAG: hypothetical protein LIP23_09895, partial [Planctomycetes bacterium]|nr:hypothetical protein [Planctomycetota bacterium]